MKIYPTSDSKVTLGSVDLSAYIYKAFDLQTEPKAIADNPHAPGTPDHREWEYENVHVPRQMPHGAARREATAAADDRIAKVRAAYRGRGEPPTFAYGKTVDELVAFVADDKATSPDVAVDPIAFLRDGWPSYADVLQRLAIQPWQIDFLRGIT